MVLKTPHVSFEAAYRQFIDEWRDEVKVPFTLTFETDPFTSLVERLNHCSTEGGAPTGFVPHSSFWLFDGDDLVGVSNLRHRLTPALLHVNGHIGFGVRPSRRRQGVGTVLLRETVNRAFCMGIRSLLVTCDRDNVGSAAVIRANGGILENEVIDPQSGAAVERYWISVG